MKNFDVNIPFPAWDGIRLIGFVCDEIRRDEFLRGIPFSGVVPRRITMKNIGPDQDGDDRKVVEYWYSDSCYAKGTLGGYESDYGTSWELTSLRLRWRDYTLNLAEVGKIELQLDADQLRAISTTSKLRHGMLDEGHWNYASFKARFDDAVALSDRIMDELSTPVRLAAERRRIQVATWNAQAEGRSFSWMPGHEPVGHPRPVGPIFPPMPPPCPKWEVK